MAYFCYSGRSYSKPHRLLVFERPLRPPLDGYFFELRKLIEKVILVWHQHTDVNLLTARKDGHEFKLYIPIYSNTWVFF